MSALRASIHFEAQEPGSMLCGVHALNNLLQAALFSPQDLAQLAQELDDLEDAQLSHARVGPSANFDETGYFSVGVMEQALAVMGLKMVRWGAQEMADVHDRPEYVPSFPLLDVLTRAGSRRRSSSTTTCIGTPSGQSTTRPADTR